jgi:deazaflavin-dependent oxidoreductase (nitroreductase family)
VPLPRGLARFNRKVANPAIRLVAGWLPPLAIVRHRGRVTGRRYATPVVAFGAGDDLVIGILYGRSSDWVNNLLAANGAQVRRLGTTREYAQAQLIGSDEGLRLLPGPARGAFRLLGVRNLLRLRARL